MKKIVKTIIILCAFGTLKAQLPPSVTDSTFFYNPDGSKNWFYYQKDVAVFRYAGGAAFTGTLPALVTSITWLGDDPHGYNLITWDSSATNAQIDITNAYMAGDPSFEYGFIPCTKNKSACASAKKWYMGSDLINVRWKDPTVTSSMLSAFESDNNVTLYHRPDSGLPNADSWTWVFKLNDLDRFQPYDACARIWYANQSLISHCEPDMAIYKTSECTLPNEFAAWASTAHPDALWHIKNNGNTVYQSLGAGTAGADAKLCECWGAGYTGEGIKVAVIDGGGYDYTHPDLAGQFLSGYDFINMTSFSSTHFASGLHHGMMVSSVIASIPNGGQTPSQPINASVVGGAYNCKILPYIVNVNGSQTIANTQIGMAIQQAVLDGADVVNMSFYGSYPNMSYLFTTVYNDIISATTTGRSGNGIVFVAATGNDNVDNLFWPAAMNEVIGVGATDENDFRGSYLQTNPWTWQNIAGDKGSNYYSMTGAGSLPHYDVVAPGTDIRVAFTDSPTTTPFQTSISQTGTSFATPIVASIAAMIIEKYPTMSFQQVTSMINNTADKVKSGTTYNYSQYANVPGYDSETFYGRVNCGVALNNPTAGVKENTKRSSNISMFYLNSNEADLLLNGTNTNGYTLNIYDITGRQIGSQKIEAGKNTYPINTESFVKGVYLFNVISYDNSNGKAFKYVK